MIDALPGSPKPGESPELPLVTVCVPTIGRVEYLGHALRSLAEQSYSRLEILILDNASPPDAQEELERFRASRTDTRILRVDERVPMFPNFNRGLREARGKYVVYFHDDDVYQPTFIARHVEVLEQNPTAGFAGGNFDVVDRSGRLVREHRGIGRTELVPGRRFIETLVRRGRGDLSTPAILFRRDLLAAYGFDEALPVNWGDFTILMRMAEEADVAVIAETHYSWRVHGENGSSMPLSAAIPLRTRVMESYCAEFRRRHPAETALARRLWRHTVRAHRIGLVWGWFAASSEAEAEACRHELKKSFVDTQLARGLKGLQRVGLSLAQRQRLLPLLRRMGEGAGV